MRDFDLLDLLGAKNPEARFLEFHEANPDVYATLVRLARTKIERTGCRKLAIAQLFEVVRWDIEIATGTDDYKVNNDFRAYYARLIMHREPDLAGYFETRRQAIPFDPDKAA